MLHGLRLVKLLQAPPLIHRLSLHVADGIPERAERGCLVYFVYCYAFAIHPLVRILTGYGLSYSVRVMRVVLFLTVAIHILGCTYWLFSFGIFDHCAQWVVAERSLLLTVAVESGDVPAAADVQGCFKRVHLPPLGVFESAGKVVEAEMVTRLQSAQQGSGDEWATVPWSDVLRWTMAIMGEQVASRDACTTIRTRTRARSRPHAHARKRTRRWRPS